MQIDATPLPGLLVLTPSRHSDLRGHFEETFSRSRLRSRGIEVEFEQDNLSLSLKAGTVRGLHFQAPPSAQAKLVRCAAGRLFDVAVDLRHGSATFGQWFGTELSRANGRQLFIPEGFAHGFVTREDGTEIAYKCSAPYDPAAERSIAWNDPMIGIDWGIEGPAILSEKDRAAPPLDGLATPFRQDAQIRASFRTARQSDPS